MSFRLLKYTSARRYEESRVRIYRMSRKEKLHIREREGVFLLCLDIAYDVEVFYSPSNIRELNLNEWPDPPNPLQSKALIFSLKYNDWFTSLVAKGPSM